MAKVFWENPGSSAGRALLIQHRRTIKLIPGAENLEDRCLLSGSEPLFKFNTVGFGGVAYIISITGPGQVQTQKCGHRSVALKLVGTTQDSTLTVSAFNSRTNSATTPLNVMAIKVRSGRLGSIAGLTSTDLEGRISTLQGPVTSIQLDSIGPKGQINIVSGNSSQPSVNGNLGQLTVNRGITLGPSGFIDVGNDLTGPLSVATDLTLNGGQIDIGRDLSGAVSIGGNLTINDGGQLDVTRNLGTAAASSANAATTSPTSTAASSTTSSSTASTTSSPSGAGISITGNLTLDNGSLAVGGNAGSLTAGGNFEASDGGGITVAGNMSSFTVNGGSATSGTGNLTLNPGGSISVGGNLSTLIVGNLVELYTGTQIQVTGNLTTFSVGGNLDTATGGQVRVMGNLGTLSVTGMFQGKGPGGGNDLSVGDDLGQITILGGGDGIQGLQAANISATSDIQGIDIRNGIANSLIEAGYLINGGTPGAGSNSWNIGPDGAPSLSSVDPDIGQIAVLNSTIQAGYEIQNMTIGGDVVSDLPSSPAGAVTRIVAGKTLASQYVPNGIIDSFQIIGNLINSVVAASVAPNTSTGYYDKPAGTIEVGFTAASTTSSPITPSQTVQVQTNGVTNVGLQTSTPTSQTPVAQLQESPLSIFTAPPFANSADPESTQVLTGGQINPSLAAKLQPQPPAAASGTELPLPTKSTVLGSVITTAPGTGDYAGFFAANTNGVLVGPLPTSAPISPAP
jgi:hypothetical protein